MDADRERADGRSAKPVTEREADSSLFAALGRAEALLAALAGLAVFALAHGYALGNFWLVNDDTRQQLFWMRRWIDPSLYPADLLTEYARHYVPWGVQGLYRLGALVMDPLEFSKYVAGVLFAVLSGAMFALGRRFGGGGGSGRGLGWAMACACWLMPFFLHNISGGLARSFAAPLVALFLLAFSARNALGTGLALAAQALFIPYIFLLCGAACGLDWVWSVLRRERPAFPATRSNWALTGALCLCILAWHWTMHAAGYGPMAAMADMVGNPEFGPQGRYRMLPVKSLFEALVVDPFERVGLFHEGGTWAGVISLVVLGAAVCVGALRARWRPVLHNLRGAVFLSLSSLALFFLARLVLLRLFLPQRYVQYTVNLLYALLLALCLLGLVRLLAKGRRWVGPVVVLCCVLLGGWRLHGQALYDYSADRDVVLAVEQAVPKAGLVAGHPALMDNVLALGSRPVLASCELAHPWSLGLWRQLKPRLTELFNALYATDGEAVRLLAEKYGVTHMVVRESDYDPQFMSGQPFFEPFGEQVRQKVGSGPFVLQDKARYPSVAGGEGWRIVELR